MSARNCKHNTYTDTRCIYDALRMIPPFPPPSPPPQDHHSNNLFSIYNYYIEVYASVSFLNLFIKSTRYRNELKFVPGI